MWIIAAGEDLSRLSSLLDENKTMEKAKFNDGKSILHYATLVRTKDVLCSCCGLCLLSFAVCYFRCLRCGGLLSSSLEKSWMQGG